MEEKKKSKSSVGAVWPKEIVGNLAGDLVHQKWSPHSTPPPHLQYQVIVTSYYCLI